MQQEGGRGEPDMGNPDVLLTLWERSVGLPPHARDEVLLTFESNADEVRTAGERNARLSELISDAVESINVSNAAALALYAASVA